jgi:hypothetical protein
MSYTVCFLGKSDGRSWTRKWRDCDYVKRYISVIIYDAYITYRLWCDVMWCDVMWWLSTEPLRRPLGSVASLLASTFFQGIHDRNHMLWIIGWTER